MVFYAGQTTLKTTFANAAARVPGAGLGSGSKQTKVSTIKNLNDPNAPQLTDRDEYVSSAEYAFVMDYIKNHSDEGFTDVDLTNYYVQNVGVNPEPYVTETMNGSETIYPGEHMVSLYFNSSSVIDYSNGKGPRLLIQGLPLNGSAGPQYKENISDNNFSLKTEHYRYFYIEYEGKTALYLGYDFAAFKSAQGLDLPGDGIYNDWVLKITPYTAPVVEDPDVDEDPVPNNEGPAPTQIVGKGEVEVNLSVNAAKVEGDYIASKLSIHVRDTSDVEVFLPVRAEFYCDTDDMNIVLSHRLEQVAYNTARTNSMSMEIAGQTVTLTVTYEADGIRVTTSGINATVLKYLRETYGDGLTFEVWNYYHSNLITRDVLQESLNLSTVEFLDGRVGKYINAFGKVDEAPNPLDCTVFPINPGYALSGDTNEYHKIYLPE
jgi:hypothetical protein